MVAMIVHECLLTAKAREIVIESKTLMTQKLILHKVIHRGFSLKMILDPMLKDS